MKRPRHLPNDALPIAYDSSMKVRPSESNRQIPRSRRLHHERRDGEGAFEGRRHSLARKWFDVSGRIADKKHAFGCHLLRPTRERGRTTPYSVVDLTRNRDV